MPPYVAVDIPRTGYSPVTLLTLLQQLNALGRLLLIVIPYLYFVVVFMLGVVNKDALAC